MSNAEWIDLPLEEKIAQAETLLREAEKQGDDFAISLYALWLADMKCVRGGR